MTTREAEPDAIGHLRHAPADLQQGEAQGVELHPHVPEVRQPAPQGVE